MIHLDNYTRYQKILIENRDDKKLSNLKIASMKQMKKVVD